MEHAIRVIFGGDVMLGRLVAEAMREHGPDYPLGEIAHLLAGADLAIVNLECAITDTTHPWPGEPKAFYFGAPPMAAQSLRNVGVDVAVLANNHVLDFGFEGLRDTLSHLDDHDIRHAGAGHDLASARAPAILAAGGVRLGIAAYCDHQADFAADCARPGIAYLDLDDEAGSLRAVNESVSELLAHGVDWPVLSLHWGPNMVERPSPAFRRFAHAAIDAGCRLVFGHSAHVFHGVELYRGWPILYAAGDLVDDYYVDPDLRNDQALLFELTITGDRLHGITLHPLLIEDCRVRPVKTGSRDIAERARRLCAELGTEVAASGSGGLRIQTG